MGFRIGASALDRFLRVRCGRRGALAWSGRLTLAVSSLVFVLLASGTPASAASFGHARFARCGEGRCLELAGRPFFVYGAAFFYERLPRERWAGSLRELRALGINTLDLYVPWNWHERSDGDFDFSGRTNPRRDLRYLVSLIRRDGFAVIVRPGPVIRNEWRNGGYPAWLLKRPEYGMPPHDLLEGRYPPLATLQNAHSDDAAAGWLANATHRHYAARWLRHALAEFRPIADRVIGVALDDDQGAYLDNQTYPAPHLRAYLEWLAAIVHGATSPHELVFINTYEMRVPASSPVWTVGDWYQSRAYAIGAHDRADLDFSTALLGTRPGQPIVLGEFQAGWLQQPQDLFPRPAAPSNTLLAGVELLGLGARGIVNFPAQDTVYPAGWEVPFANPLYAWDAALRLDGTRSARYLPTARIGSFVRAFGESLAAAQVVRDAAIAYLGESLAPAGAQGPSPFALAAATIAAQRTCRRAGLSCALVDLAAPGSNLAGARVLVVPSLPGARMRPTVRARIASLRAGGIVVLAGSPSPHALRAALAQAGMQPAVRGLIGASLAQAKGQAVRAFVTWPNFSSERVRLREVDVAWDGARRVRLPALTIPPRGALLAALDVR
ncbi:MAG: beta-galactosidase, partial [Vulcanimicrobiaceae bacterium]